MEYTQSLRNGWVFIFLLLLIGIVPVKGQSSDECTASAPSDVTVGQKFKYTVTTTERGEVVTTDFGKFELISGPSVSTSTSISMVNGQVEQSSTYTYTYYLEGSKEGSFTIPGVTISIDGRLLKSNLVIVNVLKASKIQAQEEPEQSDSWFHFDFPQWSNRWQDQSQAQSKSKSDKGTTDQKFSKDDILVKASAGQLEAYQGEAIVVTHKLYIKSDLNINRYSIERATFGQSESFWANALELNQREQSTENINGKTYTVYTIKQTAFYPTKTGKLTIPKLDLTLRVRIPVTVNDPFWGTYSSYKNQDITLTSNDIDIKVKSLPNARSTETDIVGNFSISSSISKTEVRANTPITLTITISGTGNLHNIKADDLNLEFPSDCDVTYPRVTGNISAKGNLVTGSKTFKYTIIPRAEGTYRIPAATYNFYHYDSGSYKTISSQDYQIEVSPGLLQSNPSDTEEDSTVKKKKTPAKTYKI